MYNISRTAEGTKSKKISSEASAIASAFWDSIIDSIKDIKGIELITEKVNYSKDAIVITYDIICQTKLANYNETILESVKELLGTIEIFDLLRSDMSIKSMDAGLVSNRFTYLVMLDSNKNAQTDYWLVESKNIKISEKGVSNTPDYWYIVRILRNILFNCIKDEDKVTEILGINTVDYIIEGNCYNDIRDNIMLDDRYFKVYKNINININDIDDGGRIILYNGNIKATLKVNCN